MINRNEWRSAIELLGEEVLEEDMAQLSRFVDKAAMGIVTWDEVTILPLEIVWEILLVEIDRDL
jgi:hypothetical protein